MRIRFKRFSESAILPRRMTDGSSGLDLFAAIPQRIAIACFHREVIPCGIGIELPPGYEAQVRPRSGLSKKGIQVILGTIDRDYRGEIGAVVANFTDIPFIVHPGDRIAQLVVAPVVQAIPVEVDELNGTARGDAGFGSTGVGAIPSVELPDDEAQ